MWYVTFLNLVSLLISDLSFLCVFENKQVISQKFFTSSLRFGMPHRSLKLPLMQRITAICILLVHMNSAFINFHSAFSELHSSHTNRTAEETYFMTTNSWIVAERSCSNSLCSNTAKCHIWYTGRIWGEWNARWSGEFWNQKCSVDIGGGLLFIALKKKLVIHYTHRKVKSAVHVPQTHFFKQLLVHF